MSGSRIEEAEAGTRIGAPREGENGMGRQLVMADAMKEALEASMNADENVFVLGEDIGRMGGVAGQTRGLYQKFGPDRLIDAPISEAGFFGLAAGAAQAGLRPVIELMRVDFVGVAMDQLYNYIAKIGYCTGGRRRIPLTLMTQVGNPLRQGAVHAQTLYGTFAHIPGLRLVAPATSYDAKGLLRSAVLSDDPVVFFFHASLLALPHGPGIEKWTAIDVPEEDYALPLDRAAVRREGDQVTVVAASLMVHESLRAALAAEDDGISAEVIDLRSIAPLDMDTILGSVAKTGRLVVVDEDYRESGLSAEIVARVVESGLALRAAPERVTREHVPIPYSAPLDDAVRPTPAKILAAMRKTVRR